MPRRALAFLLGIAHKGRSRDAARYQRDREVPFGNPLVKMAGRRKQAASGPPFLWILAFGEAKESISPSGARIRLNHASQELHNRINQRALHNGA
jgi:hypothetical protein